MKIRIKMTTGNIESEIQDDNYPGKITEILTEILEFAQKQLPPSIMIQNIEDSQKKNETTNLPKESCSDLFAKFNPKKHIDEALIMAYSLFYHENLQKFNKVNIDILYDQLKRPKPANISDVLAGLVEKGYTRENGTIDNLKAYELTRTGIEVVNSLTH